MHFSSAPPMHFLSAVDRPYISANNATMKAEKALKLRQSREVLGWVKLKANIRKIAVLRITRAQRL
jgi:hypothetical protein